MPLLSAFVGEADGVASRDDVGVCVAAGVSVGMGVGVGVGAGSGAAEEGVALDAPLVGAALGAAAVVLGDAAGVTVQPATTAAHTSAPPTLTQVRTRSG